MQYTCLFVWQSFEAPHTRVEPRLQISNALNQSALRSKVSIKLGTAAHNLVIGWYPFSANRHTIRISPPDSNPVYLNTICWWNEPVKEWPHEGFHSTTGGLLAAHTSRRLQHKLDSFLLLVVSGKHTSEQSFKVWCAISLKTFYLHKDNTIACSSQKYLHLLCDIRFFIHECNLSTDQPISAILRESNEELNTILFIIFHILLTAEKEENSRMLLELIF